MLKMSPLPAAGYPVKAVTMARTALGRPLYKVKAYIVDGWLVDCGSPATSGEIVRLAREQGLRGVVDSHHHKDHAGATRAGSIQLTDPDSHIMKNSTNKGVDQHYNTSRSGSG
jgi:glyoxylase-like metal-dependent hydrolase (beta-lactamase superfamily II)